MAFTKNQIFLALLLVISGSINTISVKWMDMIKAIGKDGVKRLFIHPFVQADFMLFGEILCLITFVIVYKKLSASGGGLENTHALTKGSRTFKRVMLLPPALMDITATSIMYFGLTLTNASSFQMLRGSVIVFVALLSMIVLKRKIKIQEWIGIVLIITALVVVGYADVVANKSEESVETSTLPSIKEESTTIPANAEVSPEERKEIVTEQAPIRKKREVTTIKPVDFALHVEPGSPDDSNVILGDILIIIAQLITACQLVYEELFVIKLDIPALQMVGYEGLFGFIVLSVLLIPLSYIPNIDALKHVNADGTLEDALDAFDKITNRGLLFLPILMLILSIAFYNFAGISLTKEVNATTRMVLDSIRIFIIWIFALILGWQKFHYLQVSKLI